MLNHLSEFLIINQNLIFTGLISISFAFLIWSVKESYNRHCSEIAFLAKCEIVLAENLGNLLTNQSFFIDWLSAMKVSRLYNCSFRAYIFIEHGDFKISNQELLNDLIKLNFSLKGHEMDLNLVFKNYHESSLMFLTQDLVDEWNNLNKNTLSQSAKLLTNFEHAIEDTKNCAAYLRAYANQKRYTPYGLFRFVFGRSLLPRISKKVLLKYRHEIEDDLKGK